MPRRHLIFENLSPCHIVNRGVDKRRIFQEESDYFRFIFQVYSANFGSPAPNLQKDRVIQAAQTLLKQGDIPQGLVKKEHPPFVYILNFSLMPNHIHLNLAQRVANGISRFMQKLSCGFACYFNAKYERSGTLFEGRFKAIPVRTEFQLDAVTRYINVNPLDIFQNDWKEKGLKNWQEASRFLRQYQWSSYPDFIGVRHSQLLPPKKILKMFYGDFGPKTEKSYQEFIEDYISQNFTELSPFFLDEEKC